MKSVFASVQNDGLPDLLNLRHYEIERRIPGSGINTAVYLMRHKRRGTLAVLKALKPAKALNEKIRERFVREIRVTRKLQHPSIVDFLEDDEKNGVYYFLMEYCPGGNIESLMPDRGRLSLQEAAPLLLQALEGLAYAHQEKFVHRDIKPQNILLAGQPGAWCAKVADLGLAKSFSMFGLRGPTTSGDELGTYDFMPSEQLREFKKVRPVSDVWAMGATCYYLLSGSYPRERHGRDQMTMVLEGEVIPLRRVAPHLPSRVIEVIETALEDRPEDRFQNAGEMRAALEQALYV